MSVCLIPSPVGLLLLLLSRFNRVRPCATPEMAAHQAPPPWDSPGKNTGMGCQPIPTQLGVWKGPGGSSSCTFSKQDVGLWPPHGELTLAILEAHSSSNFYSLGSYSYEKSQIYLCVNSIQCS